MLCPRPLSRGGQRQDYIRVVGPQLELFSIRAGQLVTKKHNLSCCPGSREGLEKRFGKESLGMAQDLRQCPTVSFNLQEEMAFPVWSPLARHTVSHVASSSICSATSPALGRCHSEGQESDYVPLWLLWPPPRVWASHLDQHWTAALAGVPLPPANRALGHHSRVT